METVFLQNHDQDHTSGYTVCEQGKADLVVTQVPPGLSQHQVAAIVNATTIRCFARRQAEVPLSRLGQGKVISIF
ncbi:MAG: hypothetical protein EOP38_01590 [Rubrivivax sp.]|nr:MAG: hypothetical protein EOP38_01590 [Rubrivivax sp.]